MIIKALKTFSDGIISMHEGEIANVPDTKAQRFIAEGYAVEYTGEGGDIDLSAYAKKTEAESIAFDVAKDIEGVEVVDKYIPLELTLIDGKYINRSDNGKWASTGGAKGTVLEVTEGEQYRITAGYQYLTGIYALFNSDGNKIAMYPTNSTSISTYERETVIVTIPQGVTELRASSYNSDLIIEKVESNKGIAIEHKSNILYGKKWAVCGDSFVSGDFTGYVDSQGHTGQESDAFDPQKGCYKTYPWWISNRNDMTVQLLAQGGNDFTNIDGATRPFSDSATRQYNYTQIASDCDYITLQFGLNESQLTTAQIGTKTDSDNTTLWGAYNIVLEAIITANPFAKIGIIISDSWMSQTYHDALVEIAKYWGIPYLDLKDGDNIPIMLGGKLREYSTTAKTLRDSAFKVGGDNIHPNVKGHEYRSTIIENFLRSL